MKRKEAAAVAPGTKKLFFLFPFGEGPRITEPSPSSSSSQGSAPKQKNEITIRQDGGWFVEKPRCTQGVERMAPFIYFLKVVNHNSLRFLMFVPLGYSQPKFVATGRQLCKMKVSVFPTRVSGPAIKAPRAGPWSIQVNIFAPSRPRPVSAPPRQNLTKIETRRGLIRLHFHVKYL